MSEQNGGSGAPPPRWTVVGGCARCAAPYWLAQDSPSPLLPPPLIAACDCFPERGMPTTAGGLLESFWAARAAAASVHTPTIPVVAGAVPKEGPFYRDANGNPHPDDHDFVEDFGHFAEWKEHRCATCGWTLSPTSGKVS